MHTLRRRTARLFENMIAAGVGAIIVCLINGMSPQEIVALAVDNAHRIPDALPGLVAQVFGPGFLG
jgi:hypothetical protein